MPALFRLVRGRRVREARLQIAFSKEGPLRIRRLDMHLLSSIKATFTSWKESDGKYLGYLNSHPDHWTQGEDLKAHLRDLHETFSAEDIPGYSPRTCG